MKGENDLRLSARPSDTPLFIVANASFSFEPIVEIYYLDQGNL